MVLERSAFVCYPEPEGGVINYEVAHRPLLPVQRGKETPGFVLGVLPGDVGLRCPRESQGLWGYPELLDISVFYPNQRRVTVERCLVRAFNRLEDEGAVYAEVNEGFGHGLEERVSVGHADQDTGPRHRRDKLFRDVERRSAHHLPSEL